MPSRSNSNDMGFIDFKINWFIMRIGRAFAYSGMKAFVPKINQYIKENYDSLKQEVAENDIRRIKEVVPATQANGPHDR